MLEDLPWLDWDLEFSPHLYKRMVERDFNEVQLRQMIEDATGCQRSVVEGRWVLETRLDRKPWHVVVEPDMIENVLVMITAYPVTPGSTT